MWGKLKEKILGNVIMPKVLGKLVKHATGAVVGLLFGVKLAPYVGPVLQAMDLTQAQVEAGLVVAFTGLFGAAWNFIQHRFFKKPA